MTLQKIQGLALAITHKDKILHIRGFGMAEENHIVTPQTPFYIGSLSKSFTSLASMQLSEAGQIEIDAPVKQYLPWFEVGDFDKSGQITIRYLLNQTSGLYEKVTGDLAINATMEDAARALRYSKPVDTPGTAYHFLISILLYLDCLWRKSQAFLMLNICNILEPLEMKLI